MPPPSFLLEQSWKLSCSCCPAAPGSTAEMSTLCSSHLCAIGTQPLLVPVTHPCQSTFCLQHVKNAPVNPIQHWKSHKEQATGHRADANPLLP